MNWYNYLKGRGFDLSTLLESQVFGAWGGVVILRPREFEQIKFCFDLVDKLQAKGITALVSPEPDSWADAHWSQMLEILGFVPDDLPF